MRDPGYPRRETRPLLEAEPLSAVERSVALLDRVLGPLLPATPPGALPMDSLDHETMRLVLQVRGAV
jgi:hypothetical protein